MFSSSDSSDSDDNSKSSCIVTVEAMHGAKTAKRSPPRGTIKRVPVRVPKRSVSPMANHPTFVRLKREREIEEKETEEDSSYPTSKKYRSETFARRFREMSLSDESAGISLYTNPTTLPLSSGFTLDIGSDDCDEDDYSGSDEDDSDSQSVRSTCIVYQEDPYTIHQFEKFQKRHQHNLSSSPLHRMASTVSSSDGTVTTVTISEDKTCSTVVTTLDNDDDDEEEEEEEEEEEDVDDDDDDENICETRQSSSSNSSCSGNGSCAGSDR